MNNLARYRAWSLTKRQMAQVSVLHYNLSGEVAMAMLIFPVSPAHTSLCTSDTFILLQSANRVDKDNREIYEGDVIKEQFENEFHSFQEGIGVIEYCPTHCALEAVRGKGEERLGYAIGKESEIIGNMYQNPELLKS